MKSLKTILTAAAMVVVSSLTFAKANTNVKANDSEDRHLSGFNAVSVSGSFDVYVTQGSSESVKVDAPSDIIDRIITEVDGGVLKIYTKNNNGMNWSWGNNKKIVVYVSIKDVNAVSLSGSGDVFFKNGLRAPSLKLKLTGSGDLTGKVDVKNLESNVSGSGDITISGRAETSIVSVVGSGDFTGQGLITANTSVKVAGSGDARVNAADRIDASVVGSGDVHYTGSAKNISSSKAGSGSVTRM
ncbi:head GIN domain-containing protein [Mucilaginibacter sp.]|uniref:head GIN domain-containing protein n=1 Tax=Mucilaginibacter sp. TaxID=1882438 RepID=UPI0035BBBE62